VQCGAHSVRQLLKRDAMASECRLRAAARLLQQAVTCAVEPFDFGPPRGLGLRCTQDVNIGEVLLEVPVAEAITSKWARGQVAAELGVDAAVLPSTLTPQDFLCAWLLFERGKGLDSHYAPYIEHLPTVLQEMSAAYWPEDVLAELEGCEALVRLADNRERVEDMHRSALEATSELDGDAGSKLRECFDKEGYIWARCVLNSRQFEGSWCSASEATGVLMPPFELFNHDCALPAGQCLRRACNGQRDTVEVMALRNFSFGEEALISYGCDGSARLLERGFALPDNPDESVDFVMGLRCSEIRLPELLAVSPSGENFAWLRPPAAGEDEAEARVTLRRRQPLPEALLSLSRLECLDDSQLKVAVDARAVSWTSSPSLETPFGWDCERVALSRLLAVAEAMLGRFRTTPAEDLTAVAEADGLRRMAIVARLGAQEVLCGFARATCERLLHLLDVLDDRTPEPVGGSVWFCYLRDSASRLALAQESGAFAQQFRRMQSLKLGGTSPSATEAFFVWASSKVFFWLHDGANSDAAGKALDLPKVRRWADEAVDGSACPYMKLYFEKMALWGRYLSSQFAASGTFMLSDLNTMQMETVALRNAHAWSVPTKEALDTLAKHAPLVELGCGNGLWAQALRDANGAEVLAYDLATWDSQYGQRDGEARMMGQRFPIVASGGPEQMEGCCGRTLLLMWPDYGGVGTFGSSCLQRYTGDTLLLVGEWPGHTYETVNKWGQSFSDKFVQIVQQDFELKQRVPLPCWPMALDSLMVWTRKRGLSWL